MALALAAAAFSFLAVACGLVALLQGRRPVDRRLENRLTTLSRPSTEAVIEGRGLLARDSGTFPVMRSLVSKEGSWAKRAAMDLQQAGLKLKVSEYLLARILVGALTFILVFLVLGGGSLAVLLSAGSAVGGYMLPAVYIQLRRHRRVAAINRQLAEALTLVSNALRSGFAFSQAVELAARQIGPPLQEEFNYYLRDSGLGARPEDALEAMVRRTGSVDMEMVVTSILIQRTTGGNLSEVLDNVAETIRERDRLRGEIRALTAQQRMTGNVLSVYPLALGGLFFIISPSLISLLWKNEAGIAMLVAAGTLQFIGVISIRRILSIDV